MRSISRAVAVVVMAAAGAATGASGAGCGSEGGGGAGARLTRLEDASREECPAGGQVESRGRDEDGDGSLGDDEIEERDVRCAPLREVTRIVTVPPGAQCVGGGAAQERGVDRNGNGALDDDEVTDAVYVCSTVVPFDVTVRTAAEVAALAAITEIQGGLTVESFGEDGPREVVLPALRKVTGSVRLGRDLRVTTVAMPELTTVGGDLELGGGGETRLSALAFPKLVEIGGGFTLWNNPALVAWPSLPELARVGGDFRVVSNPALLEVRVPKQRVAGEVEVLFNGKVEKLDLRSSDGAGAATVRQNAQLTELALAVTGDGAGAGLGAGKVEGNPLLERIAVTAPRVASLKIGQNPLLGSSFITTGEVTGAVEISQSRGAVTLAPLRAELEPRVRLGELRVRGAVQTLTVSGRRLRVGGAVRIEETALVQLEGIEHVGGRFDLLSNPQLVAVAPVSFFGGDVQVYDNAKLLRGELVTQPEVFGSLVFSSNPALVSVQGSLVGLQKVHGALMVLGNDQLTAVSSPVSQIDGALVIEGNDQLALLQLEGVPQTSRLSVQFNHALTALALPALARTGQILLVTNPAMAQLSLPALTSATALEARGNAQLATCQLQALCDGLGLTGTSCALSSNGAACP